jgi:adenine-specific DNA-methyltransferase
MDNVVSSLAMNIEAQRLSHTQFISVEHKSNLGQYFTPYLISTFMASLFPATNEDIVLLDPGAGIGSLTSAFLERTYAYDASRKIKCICYEIDESCLQILNTNLSFFADRFSLDFEVIQKDFIQAATDSLFSFEKPVYTHIIMNPPYKKIHSNSLHRKLLKSIGIETINLYAAFVSLAIELLQDDGLLVAIIPRSFCNGVYYHSFRKHLFNNTVIRRIHLFESRKSVFKDENVLQENIIVMLQKNNSPANVEVSYSADSNMNDISIKSFDYNEIIDTASKDLIINIPSYLVADNHTLHTKTLDSIRLKVSTGPVVDFRSRDNIISYQQGCIPLIYPFHIDSFTIKWPKTNPKKPDGFIHNDQTAKMLYPKGYYILVKRFSSKEEKRRIVAAIIKPEDFDQSHYAFENHLNLFHSNGQGLPEDIAWGLLCFLNTEEVDTSFRLFSGHTQVNAFDLRRLTYPGAETLTQLGRIIKYRELNYANFESALKEV